MHYVSYIPLVVLREREKGGWREEEREGRSYLLLIGESLRCAESLSSELQCMPACLHGKIACYCQTFPTTPTGGLSCLIRPVRISYYSLEEALGEFILRLCQ